MLFFKSADVLVTRCAAHPPRYLRYVQTLRTLGRLVEAERVLVHAIAIDSENVPFIRDEQLTLGSMPGDTVDHREVEASLLEQSHEGDLPAQAREPPKHKRTVSKDPEEWEDELLSGLGLRGRPRAGTEEPQVVQGRVQIGASSIINPQAAFQLALVYVAQNKMEVRCMAAWAFP